MRTPRRFSFGLQTCSGLYLWAAFIITFGIWKPDLFLTSATVHSIASSQAIAAMLALALLIPLTAGVYDLSVGAVINVSTILVVEMQTKYHHGMWTAIVVSILVCSAIGAFSGFIVVKLKVNSFVATLGMATIVSAIQLIISDQSQPLPPNSPAWTSLTQKTVFGFQIVGAGVRAALDDLARECEARGRDPKSLRIAATLENGAAPSSSTSSCWQ